MTAPSTASLPTAREVTALHDELLRRPDWPTGDADASQGPTWLWIATNHLFNSRLWAEEDLARRTTVGDGDIAKNKRAIDGFNQARNDATERVDELMLISLGLVDAESARSDAPVSKVPSGARLNSETAGAMIDRLSIMALKAHAMRQQAERTDADADHLAASRVKLDRLLAQRADLAGCLDALLADTQAGRAYFKVYRQFKMYNDPRFNPVLVAEQRAAAQGKKRRGVKVLVVKTTSMGDVVHALPAIADMHANVPNLQVDWLVEAPFASIPAMHPGVHRVLPLAWRKWRKKLGSMDTWHAIGAFRQELRRERYDLVLDMQGLLKSVLWAVQARGPLVGYDRAGAKEAAATLFYQRKAKIPWAMQAVERCRRLAAIQLDYALPTTGPDFGIRAPSGSWMPPGRFAVLIPGASRIEKLWPEADWTRVGQWLQSRGQQPVVLWGSDAERQMADRIAQACGGLLPPFLSVKDSAAVLGGCDTIVGLDTGFTHLGAALGRPTLGIYCDYDPGHAAITGKGPVASVGGVGVVPSLQAVMDLLVPLAGQGDVAAQSSSMRTGG